MNEGGPTVLVSVQRDLLERLLPGALAEAEALAEGFGEFRERRAWIAGRLGVQLESVLAASAVPRRDGAAG